MSTRGVISPLCAHGHVKTGVGRKRTLNGETRHYPSCLVCRRASKQRYLAAHPEKVRLSGRHTKLKHNYGMTVEEYAALLEIQDGGCAVCGHRHSDDQPLYVDHIGQIIRGLLCRKCNFACGLLADQPERAERLARYMRGDGFTRLTERGGPMKISIESTTKKVFLGGVEARIWEGFTQGGIPVHCYITRIAVGMDQPPEVLAQFDRDLQEQRAPSPAIAAIPLQLIL